MYENIKVRLADFAASIGLNDKDFEASIGMPKCTLRRLESEVKSSVISSAIRVYPQLSPDWLLNGVGPMTRPMREHPCVIDLSEDKYAISEPTASFIKKKDAITLPYSVYDELLNQLQKKDQQIEDASAQIRTLFELLTLNKK